MCDAFTESMKVVHANLQSSLAENPGKKEALEKIPELVENLQKKLSERRSAIVKDQATDGRELLALMAEESSASKW
jgi:hypothetical protein